MANGDLILFGTYLVNGEKRRLPQNPVNNGDAVLEYTVNSIGFGDTGSDPAYQLRWIEYTAGGKRLFICDRVLQVYLSWDQLNALGLSSGLPATIDGQSCIVRLPTGGTSSTDKDNEWDALVCGASPGSQDAVWHWSTMYTWCSDTAAGGTSQRTSRGGTAADRFRSYYTDEQVSNLGFRPVLEFAPGVPILSGEAGEQGELGTPLKRSYAVSLPGGGSFSLREEVDGALLRELPAQQAGSFLLDLSPVWSSLTNDAAHTATVTATSEEGNSAALQWSFVKANRPPLSPVLEYPQNGMRTGPEGFVEFFLSADPEGDAQKPALSLSKSADFPVGETTVFTEGLERLAPSGEWQPAEEDALSSGERLRLPYTVSVGGADEPVYLRVSAADPLGSGKSGCSESISLRLGNKLSFETQPISRETQPLGVTLALDRTVDEAACLRVWAANNALDDTPVWEEITAAVLSGKTHTFQNQAALSGSWAVAVRVEAEAGNATKEIRLRSVGIGII